MEDAIENPLSGISKELQAVIVVDKRVTQVEKKVDIVRQELERLEFYLPILPIEADRITEAVRKRGVDILGGKGSNAYQDRSMRQWVYSNIYADLKANFRVRSYKSIKRNQCDSALNVIARYDAPLYLQDEIYMINVQHSIWDDWTKKVEFSRFSSNTELMYENLCKIEILYNCYIESII